MKKILLILGGALAVLITVAVAIIVYFQTKWPLSYPETPFPEITASTDSSVIAEGKYLFNSVAHCNACHAAPHEYLEIGAQNIEGVLPKGGYEWAMGPLGTIRSRNITSHKETGVGNLTDSEIARTIQYGIKKNHEAAPFMFAVGPMSEEDLTAVVSYLRTIPSVENKVLETEISWFGKILLQTALKGFIQPKPQDPNLKYVPRSEEASLERGRYLANGPAMCFGCHSEAQMSPVLAIIEPRFAGNPKADPDMYDPEMEIAAPNLTPDPKTGRLSAWSEEDFIKRIRAGRSVKGSSMPWENFRTMTDADLSSIYRYLKSLKPVERETGPTYRKKGWKPSKS